MRTPAPAAKARPHPSSANPPPASSARAAPEAHRTPAGWRRYREPSPPRPKESAKAAPAHRDPAPHPEKGLWTSAPAPPLRKSTMEPSTAGRTPRTPAPASSTRYAPEPQTASALGLQGRPPRTTARQSAETPLSRSPDATAQD